MFNRRGAGGPKPSKWKRKVETPSGCTLRCGPAVGPKNFLRAEQQPGAASSFNGRLRRCVGRRARVMRQL
eukprot:6061594-Prymnesium_polylepis.1